MQLSSLFLATLLPAILLGLPGGAVADRLGPGRGYAAGALLRLAPVAAAVMFLDGSTSAWIFAFAYSTGSQVFSPAEMALVRPLQQQSSGRMHSVIATLQYVGQGTGMLVIAPALYFAGGPTAMLFGAAAGFALLTALTSLLAWRLSGVARDTPHPGTVADAMRFSETCRFFLRESLARYAVVALALKMVVSKGIVVALPFYLSRDLGLGFNALAFLAVPGIAGIVAGLLWCSRSVTKENAHAVMRWSIVGLAVSMAALAALDYGITAAAQYSFVPPIARLEASMNTTFVVAVPVALLLGACISGVMVASRVALTETAPLGQQARVFAVQLTLTETFVALPLLAAGVGTTYAGARFTLGVLAMVVVMALLVVEFDRFRTRRGARATEAGVPFPAPSPVQ